VGLSAVRFHWKKLSLGWLFGASGFRTPSQRRMESTSLHHRIEANDDFKTLPFPHTLTSVYELSTSRVFDKNEDVGVVDKCYNISKE
jgi:hypothetical protein